MTGFESASGAAHVADAEERMALGLQLVEELAGLRTLDAEPLVGPRRPVRIGLQENLSAAHFLTAAV